MTTSDFITELFCPIDDLMKPLPKHPQATLWPSELVTLGVLYALKGVGSRAFYRWLVRECRRLFPRLPSRTRLFRRLKTHWRWTYLFMAQPPLLGGIDTYGIELLHPIREGRSRAQFARNGLSNHRWLVGAKRGLLLSQFGLIVGWAWAPANTPDPYFQPLIEAGEDRMVVLGDIGFHTAAGDPSNLKLCRRGEWNTRMLVETVLSMLTGVCHLKKVAHRVAAYFQARLAFTMATFNLLAQWDGLPVNEAGFVSLSIAEFSL